MTRVGLAARADADGYVARHEVTQRGRSQIVRITAGGHAALDAHAAEVRAVIEQYLDGATLAAVGAPRGLDARAVQRILLRFGVRRRPQYNRKAA